MTLEELRDQMATVSKDIKAHVDATKERFGAVDKTLSDSDERWTQARADLMSNDQVKALVDEMIELSMKDPNRSVNLVDNLDYSTRSLREVACRTDTPQPVARELFEQFLTSRPQSDNIARYQKLSSKMTILQTVMRKANPDWRPIQSRHPRVMIWWHEYRSLQRDLLGDDFFARAFDTATAADGGDWVPDLLGADLIRYLEVYGNLIPNLRTFPMPGPIYRLPITTTANKAVRATELTGHQTGAFNYSTSPLYADGSYPASKVTFDAEKMRAFFVLTGEIIEDSIVPALEFATVDTADAIRRAIEDAGINGDDASPGIDADLSYSAAADGTYDARTSWQGFRALANTNSAEMTAASNIFTIANAVGTMRKMGRYATRGPSNLLWICGIKSYLDLLDTGDLLTMDKIGDKAVVATGAVGNLLGTSVIISEFVREDLAATGLNTTTTDAKTEAILVYRPAWRLGNYRGITTEQERKAGFDQNVVFAWWRGDLQKTVASTETTEATLIDLATT
jgi:HK97 family phage major capsid protein